MVQGPDPVDLLHISDFDSKIYILLELFPFKVENMVHFHEKFM